jgi:4-amino-4-deoxy-L-arabinose transferase-like glycosyltransferase
VCFSIASVLLIYLLVRRYGGPGAEIPAALAALLLAASPFAFAFSRLVTLDAVVVFEFCLLMWLASCANRERVWPLTTLGLLIPVMMLTKTTAAALLPSVIWLLWMAKAKNLRRFMNALLMVVAIAGAVLASYLSIVLRSRYADDLRYFFDINALPSVEPARTGSYLLQLLHHCMWIDRVLYPAALVVLLLSPIWLRRLWRNPLFTASWIAFAGQALYILRRQDDYAPRYFLAMLVPVILVLVLTLQELSAWSRPTASVLTAVLALAVLLDAAQILGFLNHRQYHFDDAAKSIQNIVNADRSRKRLLLGASADQLSLMTGIPAINDGYSYQDLGQKASAYQPGWYVGWNNLDQDIAESLSSFRLDKVTAYRVFDNEQREWLTLYRMVPEAHKR